MQSIVNMLTANETGFWPVAGASVLLAIILLLLYQAALPKPLPGIPYNVEAARQLWGDAAAMTSAKRPRGWMRNQFARHNSPIVQLFMSPLQKPWILVSDFSHANDIMVRRNKEFDRSGLTRDCFEGILPEFHFNMRSKDPRYKSNKELLRDLMTPSFLNEVSAPGLHEKTVTLVDLWTHKATLADRRPFRADLDIYSWALDLTMAVTFHFPKADTMMLKQLKHTAGRPAVVKYTESGEQAEFETVPLDPELDACVYLTKSVGVAFRSNVPRLAHWLYLHKSYSRQQVLLKDALIRRNVDQSLERLARRGMEKKLTCAVDQILLRENDMAEKAGRKPDFHKRAIYDELFGFILGGHDTTTATFQWWVKFMGRSQESQSRLRKDLYAAHPAAVAGKRLPTAQEITSTDIPYLDAMMEETLRVSHIVTFVTRETIADTQILGYHIPKGHQIMFATTAEGFMRPALKVDEARKVKPSGNERSHYGVWDPSNVGEFIPERWMKRESVDEKGTAFKETFDSRSGPSLPFGAGPRGCFGRRLAYLEMRIAMTILLWKFEFMRLPDKIASLECIDTSTETPIDCYIALRTLADP